MRLSLEYFVFHFLTVYGKREQFEKHWEKLVKEIGEKKASALLGIDFTAKFSGKSKAACWKILNELKSKAFLKFEETHKLSSDNNRNSAKVCN